MTRVAVAFILLAWACVARAQTLPTLAQCKADQSAWIEDVRKDFRFTNLSWEELRRRAREMSDCEDATVEAAKAKVEEAMTMKVWDYRNLVYWYQQAMLWRLEKFLDRHNMSGQFSKEDEQGLR